MRMKSLRGVGVGLSVVFGCLLLALVAELYYLLWWKKKFATNRGDLEVGYNSISSSTSSRIFFCCKKIQSFSRSTQAHQPQSQFQLNSDQFWNKPFGEETAEAELFRLQNFPGPPRFLFTIKEETKEDLESEDAKSRGERSRKGSRSKSLSEFFHNLETPYMTPVASPQYFTPPLTPATGKSTYLNHGFDSFDSASEAEFNFLVRSSPSPKFQFLKDAEEKLHRKQYGQDAEIRRNQEDVFSFEATSTSSMFTEENGRHQSVFHNVLNS